MINKILGKLKIIEYAIQKEKEIREKIKSLEEENRLLTEIHKTSSITIQKLIEQNNKLKEECNEKKRKIKYLERKLKRGLND